MHTTNPIPALEANLARLELNEAMAARAGRNPEREAIFQLEAAIDAETRALLSAGLHPTQR